MSSVRAMFGRVSAAALRASRGVATRAATVSAGAKLPAALAAVAGVTVSGTAVAFCAQKNPPRWGVPGTKQERTFIAIKPDGVQRGIVGQIIARFETRGYKLVGLKMVYPTKKMAEEHYADLSKKGFFGSLTDFFSSGPIVCMCWEGQNVVKQGRQMMGETNPQASIPGSIRGDFSIDLGRNIIHGSDSTDSAAHEIKMWFTDEEIQNYTRAIDTWIYEK